MSQKEASPRQYGANFKAGTIATFFKLIFFVKRDRAKSKIRRLSVGKYRFNKDAHVRRVFSYRKRVDVLYETLAA